MRTEKGGLEKTTQRTVSLILSLLMIMLSFPTLAVQVTTEESDATNSTQIAKATASNGTTFTITGGKQLSYDSNINWTTTEMKANGRMVYCVNPKLPHPTGTYDSNNLNKVLTNSRNFNMLYKMLNYGYGGKDFNTNISAFGNISMKRLMDNAKTNHWLGASTSDGALYYLLTHRVLAKIYGDSNWSYALTSDWISAVNEIYNAINKAPNLTSKYDMYILSPGRNYQNVIILQDMVGSLEIIKDSSNYSLTDNNNCYSLYGAVFTVTNTSTNQKYTATATTKVNDGSATVKYKAVLSVPAGNYKIQETTAPKGYALSSEIKTVTVNSGSTATTSITFNDIPQNDPVGVVVKKNSDTNRPVAGAEFTVKFYKGLFTKEQIESGQADSFFKRYWILKTDENGRARLDNKYLIDSNNDFYEVNGVVTLPLGTVTIQETKAPSGYKIDNTLNVQQITSNGGSVSTVVAFNEFESINDVTSYYELTKTSEDGIVSNVKFNIYKGSSVKPDNFLKTVTTDRNGKIKEKLDVGTYTFEELTDSRYETQKPKTITITGNNTSGNPAKISFTNTLKSGWLKLIKTAEDGNIKGIAFEVYDSSKKLVGTYTTNAQGLIANDIELKPGEYTIHEVPVDGYVVLPDRTVTIVANQTSTVRFNNSKQGGQLKIKKTSDYFSTDIVTFKVEGLSNSFKDEIQVRVGRNQTISLPYAGRYKVTEVLTEEQLKYWDKPTQAGKEIVIENGQTAEVDFSNHEKTGNLKITKKASDNVVSGVQFLIAGTSYSGNSVYSVITTNENGEYIANNIPVGEYTIEEIRTPSDTYYSDTVYTGTVKIDNCETAVIETNKTSTVEVNNETSRKIKIVKTNTYDNVQGFKFRVSCEALNYNKTFVTDENGNILVEELKAGRYKVEEILDSNSIYEQPEAQYIDVVYPKNLKEFNTTYTVNFENKPKNGYCQIVKTSESGKIKGFEFTIKGFDYLGNAVNYENLKTDENGIIKKELVAGTYTVEEVNVPSYYVQPEPQEIEILPNETKSVKFYNEYSRGNGEVIKTSDDGITAGFKFRLYGTSDNGEEINLTKTTTTQDRIEYSEDGTTTVTTKVGVALFNDVPTGTYTVEEIETPSRYEKLETQTIVIEKDKTSTVSANNKLKRGKIGTTAKDSLTNEHYAYANQKTTIIDTVQYSGLGENTDYLLRATLMDKSTNSVVKDSGTNKKVVSIKSFETTKGEGSVDVPLTFNSTNLMGKDVVVFEELLYKDINGKYVPLATHRDINDEGQTISFRDVTVHTTAIDKDTNTHTSYISRNTTIIDTVEFTGLNIGSEYTIKGILMDEQTGEPLLNPNNEEITSEKTFIADTKNGSINLEFTFDSNFMNERATVVFEYLYFNGTEIGSHTDLTDENQTITFSETPKGTIKFTKVDENNKPLANVKFAIFTDENLKTKAKNYYNKEFTNAISTSKGVVRFSDVAYGTYYISEIKTQNGKQLLENVLKATVSDKGTILEYNGKVIKNNIISNNNIPDLPYTGGVGIGWVITTGSVFLGIAVFTLTKIIRLKKKGGKNNEKI